MDEVVELQVYELVSLGETEKTLLFVHVCCPPCCRDNPGFIHFLKVITALFILLFPLYSMASRVAVSSLRAASKYYSDGCILCPI